VTIHASSGRRVALVSAAVLGLLVASVGSVSADTTPPGDVSYSQAGSYAELYASRCTSNGDDTVSCAEEYISVFSGRMTDSVSGVTRSNQLCVSVASYTYSELAGEYVGSPSFERGCRTDLPSGAFRIDSKLASATLADTPVAVVDEGCEKFGCEPGAGREIVVAATWTGFGPLRVSKSHGSSDDGTCRSRESFKGSSRSADVAGSLDGQPIVADDVFGLLSSGKYSFTSSCSEV
jgi:hypothetical protein